ncbi:MAG: polysaccharide deacetylase family protein [Methanothrix sp.]|nr:polysaccharide deacetylase family protein [Methanothrix sp.]
MSRFPIVCVNIPQSKVRILTWILVGVFVISLSLCVKDQFIRYVHGVRPGVHICGQDIGGLLEGELLQVLHGIKDEVEVAPVNARYDPATGQITTEISGVLADVPATAKRALQAKTGEEISFVMHPVRPAVTSDMFSPIYQVKTTQQVMSLAVNVDWGEDVLPEILSFFKTYGVYATFFLTGPWTEKNPALAREIVKAGHEIGSHGYWHAPQTTRLSDTDLMELIVQAERVIMEHVGYKPLLFAPPAGDVDKRVTAMAASLGFRTIMWTLDTIDWQNPSPQTIINRVVPKASPGAIVLMHPRPNTLAALPQMIEQLQGKGYRLVSIGTMLNLQ